MRFLQIFSQIYRGVLKIFNFIFENTRFLGQKRPKKPIFQLETELKKKLAVQSRRKFGKPFHIYKIIVVRIYSEIYRAVLKILHQKFDFGLNFFFKNAGNL
jgi:hypothetical protein